MNSNLGKQENLKIKVRDIAVRIFHWSMILFFTIAYINDDEEYRQRIPIEGKFGQGKGRYRLNNIRAKQADTSVAWINSIFLVMNLALLLKVFFARWKQAMFRFRLHLWQLYQSLCLSRPTHPFVNDPIDRQAQECA